VPYVLRYNVYSMNPCVPFRVWRKHKEFFPQDTGARHLIKHYYSAYIALFIAFVAVVLICVFVGK
jgi:hypothetical protein